MIACYQAANPGIALAQSKDPERFKLYQADIGLFTTLMFESGDKDDANIYAKLLSDKLEAGLGYLYENAVAQIIRATGRELFYHSWTPAGTSHAYEVDFLLTDRTKLIPVEVKSSAVNSHKSLDVVDEGWILHSLRERRRFSLPIDGASSLRYTAGDGGCGCGRGRRTYGGTQLAGRASGLSGRAAQPEGLSGGLRPADPRL